MYESLIKKLDSQTLQYAFDERQYKERWWATFFPRQDVLSLDYETLIIQNSKINQVFSLDKFPLSVIGGISVHKSFFKITIFLA